MSKIKSCCVSIDRLRRFLPASRYILLAVVSAVLVFAYLWLSLFFFDIGMPVVAVFLVLLLPAVVGFSLLINVFFFLLKKKL